MCQNNCHLICIILHMGIFLLLALFLPVLSLDVLLPLTDFLHTWCTQKISQQTFLQVEIHKALVCGEKLPLGETRTIFTQAGLIHLMVVSGAHLIFLEKSINFLPPWPYKKIFTFACLVFYSLIAELHPPIFRALVSFGLSFLSQRFQLNWGGLWRVMFSGLICIILNPEWMSSLSLQLSWVGALAFSYKHSRMMAQIFSYIFILPLVSQWTTIHPLSIGLNWLLVPVLSVTIFPLALLSFIFPVFYPLTNTLCTALISFLTFLQPFLENVPFYSYTIPLSFRWMYLVLLFLFFLTIDKVIHKVKLCST